MSARDDHEKEQGKTAHGQSLAHLLAALQLAACLAACGDVDRLILPPLDPDDVDADDVPNAIDNCPETHNPDQHDEDGDGFGDACDVCPVIFDDQGDFGESSMFGFGDGVGDACDPRPGRDGDKLMRLDTFSTDTSDQYTGTGWQISADVARMVNGAARWENPDQLAGDGLLAQIHVPLLFWFAPGARIEVSVNGDGETTGASCAVVRDSDGDGEDELVAREIGGVTATTSLGGRTAAPLVITAWRTIDRARVAKLRCTVNETQLEIPLDDEIPSGSFGFAAADALVDVGSIATYTFPINPCFLNMKTGVRPECNPDSPSDL